MQHAPFIRPLRAARTLRLRLCGSLYMQVGMRFQTYDRIPQPVKVRGTRRVTATGQSPDGVRDVGRGWHATTGTRGTVLAPIARCKPLPLALQPGQCRAGDGGVHLVLAGQHLTLGLRDRAGVIRSCFAPDIWALPCGREARYSRMLTATAFRRSPRTVRR